MSERVVVVVVGCKMLQNREDYNSPLVVIITQSNTPLTNVVVVVVVVVL
jgi:hypothetical protein